jgi:hypothetical protein
VSVLKNDAHVKECKLTDSITRKKEKKALGHLESLSSLFHQLGSFQSSSFSLLGSSDIEIIAHDRVIELVIIVYTSVSIYFVKADIVATLRFINNPIESPLHLIVLTNDIFAGIRTDLLDKRVISSAEEFGDDCFVGIICNFVRNKVDLVSGSEISVGSRLKEVMRLIFSKYKGSKAEENS